MAETLNCSLRKVNGSGEARRLRAKRLIPGVVYGRKTKTLAITVAEDDFAALWKSLQERQSVINLVIRDEEKGKAQTVQGLLHDYQHDLLSRKFVHLDFHQVKAMEKVRISIPVELTGAAPGEKQGGIIDQVLREIEVEALPRDLPGNVALDIGAMNLGDSLYVSDIRLGDKVTIVTHAGEPIVSVLAPKKAAEEETVEAAAVEEPAVPEVISQEEAEARRKKKEEESDKK